MLKLAVKAREDIEVRLDLIDRELSDLKNSTVTHEQLSKALAELRKDGSQNSERLERRMDANQTRTEIKIDSIMSEIIKMLHECGKHDRRRSE